MPKAHHLVYTQPRKKLKGAKSMTGFIFRQVLYVHMHPGMIKFRGVSYRTSSSVWEVIILRRILAERSKRSYSKPLLEVRCCCGQSVSSKGVCPNSPRSVIPCTRSHRLLSTVSTLEFCIYGQPVSNAANWQLIGSSIKPLPCRVNWAT